MAHPPLHRHLDVVPNPMPDAPYPPDVRARGWKFELDIERIQQSDTWLLAPPDMRPWLLMVWMSSWSQAPCGSLPLDDRLIAARIGMEARLFAAHRDILLRGWYRCADDRLYHPVVSELVEQMRDSRRVDRDRKARQRADKGGGPAAANAPGMGVAPSALAPFPASVPKGRGVTPDGTLPGTPWGRTTGAEEKTQAAPANPEVSDVPDAPTAPRKRAAPAAQTVSMQALVADGLTPQVAGDWLLLRGKKKLPLTKTAWDGVKAEAAKAGLAPQQAVVEAVQRGWGGFRAAWVAPQGGPPGLHATAHAAPLNRQAALEAANRAAGEAWLRTEAADAPF